MNATQQLSDLGQSLWLDNITQSLLVDGTLARYIREYAVTGLTSNPTIFNHAIERGGFYDDAIRTHARAAMSNEALFFDLAMHDIIQAADIFRPIHEVTAGVDGWVSVEISPGLSNDSAGSVKAAAQLYARADRPNVFIKIPGTRAGIAAIEAAIFAGVPVNVTLLFSREHYLAAAQAYMGGLERRLAAGLDPRISSVASIFISRWDVAINDNVDAALRNRLGIAVAMRTYKAYREVLASVRWQKLAAHGVAPQRLLWASTATKDPTASDTLYGQGLAAPNTINTMPDETLLAFADHGDVKGVMPINGGDAEAVLAEFAAVGVRDEALADELQRRGTASFIKSWNELMQRIASKRGSA